MSLLEKEFRKTTPSPSLERLKKFRKYFIKQFELAKKVEQICLKSEPSTRVSELYPLLNSILSSGLAADILLRRGFIIETYIIGRSFLENMINYCYLQICDEKEYKNFFDYSKQKIFRSIQTQQKVYSHIGKNYPLPDPSFIHPDMPHLLNKFTSKGGKELKNWSIQTIENKIIKIEIAKNSFSASAHLALYEMLYSDASEALHGTIYGAMFPTGIFFEKFLKKGLEENLNSRRINLYLILGQLFQGIFDFLSGTVVEESLSIQGKNNFDIIGNALGMKKV